MLAMLAMQTGDARGDVCKAGDVGGLCHGPCTRIEALQEISREEGRWTLPTPFLAVEPLDGINKCRGEMPFLPRSWPAPRQTSSTVCVKTVGWTPRLHQQRLRCPLSASSHPKRTHLNMAGKVLNHIATIAKIRCMGVIPVFEGTVLVCRFKGTQLRDNQD